MGGGSSTGRSKRDPSLGESRINHTATIPADDIANHVRIFQNGLTGEILVLVDQDVSEVLTDTVEWYKVPLSKIQKDYWDNLKLNLLVRQSGDDNGNDDSAAALSPQAATALAKRKSKTTENFSVSHISASKSVPSCDDDMGGDIAQKFMRSTRHALDDTAHSIGAPSGVDYRADAKKTPSTSMSAGGVGGGTNTSINSNATDTQLFMSKRSYVPIPYYIVGDSVIGAKTAAPELPKINEDDKSGGSNPNSNSLSLPGHSTGVATATNTEIGNDRKNRALNINRMCPQCGVTFDEEQLRHCSLKEHVQVCAVATAVTHSFHSSDEKLRLSLAEIMLHSHQKKERLMYNALVSVADEMDRSNAVCLRIEHLLSRVLRVDPHVADHYGLDTLQNDINQALQHISAALNTANANNNNNNNMAADGPRSNGDSRDKVKEEKMGSTISSSSSGSSSGNGPNYDDVGEVIPYSPNSIGNAAGPKVTYVRRDSRGQLLDSPSPLNTSRSRINSIGNMSVNISSSNNVAVLDPEEEKQLSLFLDVLTEAKSELANKKQGLQKLQPFYLTLKNITFDRTLGKGAFGTVYLAHHTRDPQKKYAVKVMSTSTVLTHNLSKRVLRERRILSIASQFTDYFVHFYASFQTKDNLFLVMEYLPGGDTLSLLATMRVFPEVLAQHFIVQVALGIKFLHLHGVVHRDIKPDNVAITARGHAKLVDFGSAVAFNKDLNRANPSYRSVRAAVVSSLLHREQRGRHTHEQAHAHYKAAWDAKSVGSSSGGGNGRSTSAAAAVSSTGLSSGGSVTTRDYRLPSHHSHSPTDTIDRSVHSFNSQTASAIDIVLRGRGGGGGGGGVAGGGGGVSSDGLSRDNSESQFNHFHQLQRVGGGSGTSGGAGEEAFSTSMSEDLWLYRHDEEDILMADAQQQQQHQQPSSLSRQRSSRLDTNLSSTGTTESLIFQKPHTTHQMNSAVGNLNYACPEIVYRAHYDHTVDWWALGVLLFHYVAGKSPFEGRTLDETQDNIVSGNADWLAVPSDISLKCKELVRHLCALAPEERLGYISAEEVLRHPFFGDIDVQSLYSDKGPYYPLPYLPPSSVSHKNKEKKDSRHGENNSSSNSATGVGSNGATGDGAIATAATAKSGEVMDMNRSMIIVPNLVDDDSQEISFLSDRSFNSDDEGVSSNTTSGSYSSTNLTKSAKEKDIAPPSSSREGAADSRTSIVGGDASSQKQHQKSTAGGTSNNNNNNSNNIYRGYIPGFSYSNF